ncbi:MAG: glycosyltransferase family 4 protein [Actinomycetota bacterium]
MRVAFVTVGDPRRPTGGYLYNARVIEGLMERGVEVEEIVACGASPEEQAAAAPHIAGIFDPSTCDAVIVDALARIAVAPHLERWRKERPVVAMVHELPGVADPGSARREAAFEDPLLRSDLLVTVSEHGRRVLLGRGAPGGLVRVVPPGCDRLPVQVRERRRDGTVRALCVAQWIPRKGILELVHAWRRRKRRDAVLELIGETDADLAYAFRVREVADPSVFVRGAVSDAALAEAYACADLFALTSLYEGYGIVYAEALAAGLPVLACNVGPVPELVGREAALLVPPGDAEALAGALDTLLADAGLREKMSAAARRRAGELPGWEETVRGFFSALREAVERRGSDGP